MVGMYHHWHGLEPANLDPSSRRRRPAAPNPQAGRPNLGRFLDGDGRRLRSPGMVRRDGKTEGRREGRSRSRGPRALPGTCGARSLTVVRHFVFRTPADQEYLVLPEPVRLTFEAIQPALVRHPFLSGAGFTVASVRRHPGHWKLKLTDFPPRIFRESTRSMANWSDSLVADRGRTSTADSVRRTDSLGPDSELGWTSTPPGRTPTSEGPTGGTSESPVNSDRAEAVVE
jgi:hypothetical protein